MSELSTRALSLAILYKEILSDLDNNHAHYSSQNNSSEKFIIFFHSSFRKTHLNTMLSFSTRAKRRQLTWDTLDLLSHNLS